MDSNGMPTGGFQAGSLIAGMGTVPPVSASMKVPLVASEAESLSEGNNMTESEMEHIILKYKAAQSAKEAEKVLDQYVPDGQMSKVLDGLENEFFN